MASTRSGASLTGLDDQLLRTNPAAPARSTLPGDRSGQVQRAQLHEELLRDFAPVGAAEHILVAELARRAANMEWWSAAAGAVRHTAAGALAMLAILDVEALQSADSILAASASCAAVDRAERTSSVQSRAFFRALQMLLHLQARRQANPSTLTVLTNNPFQSEAACQVYLADWQHHHFICGGCGAGQALFIRSRNCLECAACRSQSGSRSGTVMADSPLPLLTWFTAIWFVLASPNISTVELQRQLRLSRAATVRALATKIRAALTAEDRTAMLVGLDRYFTQPESSAPSSIHGETPQEAFQSYEVRSQSATPQRLAPNGAG
jgi:hypothetical protein